MFYQALVYAPILFIILICAYLFCIEHVFMIKRSAQLALRPLFYSLTFCAHLFFNMLIFYPRALSQN